MGAAPGVPELPVLQQAASIVAREVRFCRAGGRDCTRGPRHRRAHETPLTGLRNRIVHEYEDIDDGIERYMTTAET
jgi:hypothetical protein